VVKRRKGTGKDVEKGFHSETGEKKKPERLKKTGKRIRTWEERADREELRNKNYSVKVRKWSAPKSAGILWTRPKLIRGHGGREY